MNNKLKKDIKDLIRFFLIIVTINFFLFQPFKIPSGSMIPTLLVGDFIIVDKYSYGYTNDSFRLWQWTVPLPKIKKRLLQWNKPQRGDVVVFRNEKDGNKNYIKRLIGLPGDKIQIINGVININDKPCEIKEIESYSIMDRGNYEVYKQYMEKLPNGYQHVFIKQLPFGQGYLDNVGPFTVPENCYFAMGDNRDNSQDSRDMQHVGFIPDSCLMGKAKYIFFSTSCDWYQVLKWIPSIRFARLCTAIK